MSAIDELRQSYRALGWSLWSLPGFAGMGERVTWYYATTSTGGRYGQHGETIATISPLATLEAVLAHPVTKARSAA